jgi:hypothetical protein
VIDRNARDAYAELLRHFASGRMTNREYEDETDRIVLPGNTGDLALREIWLWTWQLYDDVRTHELTGRWALAADDRKCLARAVIFLYTDVEYEWPKTKLFAGCLMNLLTFGLWGMWISHSRKTEFERKRQVWPFADVSSLDKALQFPRLMCGRQ